ncbi:hypothetical protein [Vibrio sp. VB16]|uniref:hypothetical protein n=1 Tax=Vibrio sp. VB16 TaxID=2785746 RepID=UPI00189D6A5B|nr:hypothetical protein [Vibrio sp. VB16]UGA55689.1 hypothetical protein IUZ65_004860 [Vibrio sp. VB16]
MKKTIATMGLSLAVMEAAVAAPQVTPFVEVVIYRVEPSVQHPKLSRHLAEDEKALPGFIRGIHLQSLADPYLFADINLWEEINVTRTTKSVRDSFSGTAQELELFGYFQSVSSITGLESFMRPEAVIELAAYSVKEIAIQEKSRSAVYLELENSSNLYAGMALSSVNTGGDYIDFIAWSSQQAAEETAAKIMLMPEHQAFFQNTAEIKLFDFFTVYEQDGKTK